MKKITTLLALLLLMAPQISAQNYSCISPEYKTWFTNAKGYLKGMRIDATTMSSTQKIYFPFHTARVRAENGAYADTLGGSWLGKAVVESVDGTTTYLLNKWEDTVRIKNGATLNESWILYQDSSPVFIEATVTAWDTMTMAGITDSVKTIQLKVKDANGEIAGDSLNNLELILSKHHGFFQAVELYLLPFHEPDSTAYDSGVDMYLQEYLDEWGTEFKRSHLTFKRVAYDYPLQTKIYDYHPGDMAIRKYYRDLSNTNNYTDERDSVTARVQSGDTVSIDLIRWHRTVEVEFGNTVVTNHTSNLTMVTLPRPISIHDTVKMPEEWHTTVYRYYRPDDSSFCFRSKWYGEYRHFLWESGQISDFEQSRNSQSYKEGLGFQLQAMRSYSGESLNDIYLLGVRKNGYECSSGNGPLSVGQQTPASDAIAVYPNPVRDRLTIRCLEEAMSLQVTDMAGRTIVPQRFSANSLVQLDLSSVPSGLYLLQVQTGKGRAVRKIMVQH